jgi:hypothetical protein
MNIFVTFCFQHSFHSNSGNERHFMCSQDICSKEGLGPKGSLREVRLLNPVTSDLACMSPLGIKGEWIASNQFNSQPPTPTPPLHFLITSRCFNSESTNVAPMAVPHGKLAKKKGGQIERKFYFVVGTEGS